jgi:hypothetical protein|tara:strand:- start:1432 stop:1938 length:507 start_codon:yes stop_codon:yes gene_type:complete
MAAPDLETLHDFETNVESAAKTFLQTATGLSASSAFATLDQDDLVLPRFSVALELGEALDPPDQKTTGSSEFEYLKYTGTLNIQIVTDASIDGTQTNHRSYRAKARAAMLLNADNWSTSDGEGGTILPYYDINYMRPAGTTFEQDGDLAISTLAYTINVVIRPDAWPS